MAEPAKKPRGPSPVTVALVVMAATLAAVFALWPRQDAAPVTSAPSAGPAASTPEAPHGAEPSEQAPPQRPRPGQLPEPRVQAPDSDDPFDTEVFGRSAPSVVHDGRTRYEMGKRFSAPLRMDLYRYGEDHPDDPRPQLLLAYDELRLGWKRAAVGHYERALDADPATRKSPKVLRDLVELSVRGEYDRASKALRKHYGRDALPAVDEALEEAREKDDPGRIQRLEQLRGSL